MLKLIMPNIMIMQTHSFMSAFDGQIKSANKCLQNYLRCVAGDQPKAWYKWLSLAEWWYNSTYHSAI